VGKDVIAFSSFERQLDYLHRYGDTMVTAGRETSCSAAS